MTTTLDSGNINDDQTEKLILFVRHIASLSTYDAAEDALEYGEDAMFSLNGLIEEAREYISRTGRGA